MTGKTKKITVAIATAIAATTLAVSATAIGGETKPVTYDYEKIATPVSLTDKLVNNTENLIVPGIYNTYHNDQETFTDVFVFSANGTGYCFNVMTTSGTPFEYSMKDKTITLSVKDTKTKLCGKFELFGEGFSITFDENDTYYMMPVYYPYGYEYGYPISIPGAPELNKSPRATAN